MNPQKTCHMATKMVPKLTPEHQCTLIPQEVCHLSYGSPKLVTKPFKAEWCLDESQVEQPDLEEEPQQQQQIQEEARRGRNGRRRRLGRRRRPLRRRGPH